MDNKKLLCRGLMSIIVFTLAVFFLIIAELSNSTQIFIIDFIITVATILIIFLILKSVIKDYWDNQD